MGCRRGESTHLGGPILKSILSPMLTNALDQLQSLLNVTGTGYVTVAQKSTPSSKPAGAPTCTTTTTITPAACIYGSWTVTSAPLQGTRWTYNRDGTISVEYPGVLRGPATYTTTLPPNPVGSSGTYVATPVSQAVTGPTGQPTTLVAHGTTWNCQGNSLLLNQSGAMEALARG